MTNRATLLKLVCSQFSKGYESKHNLLTFQLMHLDFAPFDFLKSSVVPDGYDAYLLRVPKGMNEMCSKLIPLLSEIKGPNTILHTVPCDRRLKQDNMILISGHREDYERILRLCLHLGSLLGSVPNPVKLPER